MTESEGGGEEAAPAEGRPKTAATAATAATRTTAASPAAMNFFLSEAVMVGWDGRWVGGGVSLSSSCGGFKTTVIWRERREREDARGCSGEWSEVVAGTSMWKREGG